jgi:Tannase and feruloyl esterase
MINGMGHCGGGPTPNSSALVQQLVSWTEHGRAPDSIVAIDQNATTGEQRQRPVYPYPLVPKYVGPDPTTNPQAADQLSNFVPAEPSHPRTGNIKWYGDYLTRPH